MKTQDMKKLDLIIYNAFNQNASEIYIEPNSTDAVVRQRIYGVLKTVERFDLKDFEKLLEQLKLLAGVDPLARVPGMGRVLLAISDKKLDLRVSTIPSCSGDMVCIHILNLEKSQSLNLDNLHITDDNLKKLKRWYSRSRGIILASGFAGNGRTALLYAVLKELNKESVKICTVEDPVEFQLDGVTQTTVNLREGMTFSSTIRALLRQSPDIMYISEIRDPEVLALAMNHAVTGHLSLGSIHAKDTVSTLFLLKNMGIAPFIIKDNLIGIVAQKLLRRLCPDCRESYLPENFELNNVQIPHGTYYKARGCEKCNNLGYVGLVPACELFEFSPATGKMFISGCSEEEFAAAFASEETKTFFDEAVKMAAEGIIGFEEISRVLS